MSGMLFNRQRLYCPGPTPIPQAAVAAGMDASIYHRSDAFYKDLLQCREMLAPFFGSKELPLILTSSGTGALEAALTNLTDVGDSVVVIDAGKFGNRWLKMSEAFGLKTTCISLEWGTSFGENGQDYSLITDALSTNPKAIFFQANETSTGVHHDVEKIAKLIRKDSDALIVVDAVSSLAAHAMKMDDWGIDCVVSGSQKGFGIPAGLSFISLSEKAWAGLSKRPRFYFDLEKEKNGQKTGSTAWTPAITLVSALKVTLGLMTDAGLDNVVAHHKRASMAVRAAVSSIGLDLLGKQNPSHAVTAFKVPANIDGAKLVSCLRDDYKAVFAGGQNQLKGKIVRFGHLGFFDFLDIVSGTGALEMALKDCGYEFELGRSLSALLNSYRQSAKTL